MCWAWPKSNKASSVNYEFISRATKLPALSNKAFGNSKANTKRLAKDVVNHVGLAPGIVGSGVLLTACNILPTYKSEGKTVRSVRALRGIFLVIFFSRFCSLPVLPSQHRAHIINVPMMASFDGFDTIPAGANGKAEAFQLHVPDTALSDFKTLLRLSPIGPETWENKTSTRDAGRYFGITRDWLVNAKDTWLEKFDWRKHEAYINSFPNFKIHIKDGDSEPLSMHFAALFSKKKDATPVIFMHGWPGCHLEFLPMLDLLRTKYTADTLPFHAIVPSLPGYSLSSGPPTTQDFSAVDAARVLNQMMIDLGFGSGYVAQGGDVGYFLARRLSFAHDECKALHGKWCRATPRQLLLILSTHGSQFPRSACGCRHEQPRGAR